MGGLIYSRSPFAILRVSSQTAISRMYINTPHKAIHAFGDKRKSHRPLLIFISSFLYTYLAIPSRASTRLALPPYSYIVSFSLDWESQRCVFPFVSVPSRGREPARRIKCITGASVEPVRHASRSCVAFLAVGARFGRKASSRTDRKESLTYPSVLYGYTIFLYVRN